MTLAFVSRRTPLAPIAAALATATSEYTERRSEADEAHKALCVARLWGAPNLNEVADQADTTVEAMSAAQEKVANLMVDLQETGVLSHFHTIAAAQKRVQN